jgi:hypothetical protein
MAKRLGGSRKAVVAVAVTWALGGAGLALQACDDDSTPNGTATPQEPDGASPAEASTSLPDVAFDVVPTGDVKGTINYAGSKRGTVVIGFLDYIPMGPPAPGQAPPKVGGFGISNPQTFPGTFATKVLPGTWKISAYMSVGQPPHLDGPTIGPGGIPLEPVGAPAEVVVKAGETVNVEIMLLDEGGPDSGTDADTEDADTEDADAG